MLFRSLGCAVPAVLPVTGSTQAMDLLCKALIDPGDVILVENPSFLGNMQCMRLYQATLVPVESDENGIIPEKLEEAMRQYHPKLLYTIPTFQNPTGQTEVVPWRFVTFPGFCPEKVFFILIL